MDFEPYINKVPINKGWSEDKKYCVTTSDGTKYLLRISQIEKYERKKFEYEILEEVALLGVPICRPVDFGICDEGVFALHSWIEGEDAEDRIPSLPKGQQYEYGIKAGKILKQIHSIPAPITQEDWNVRFNRKIDTKIMNYNNCPIKYDGGNAFIDYINANRHLLKTRPQSFQHGDYHIGNMMISQDELVIIDFNSCDYGDPWEEFNRIVWCAQASPLFASGMLEGYFDHQVPIEFWKLLALYISNNTLSSIPWAINFGQQEIDTMIRQAQEVLKWYDNMQNSVPSWYGGLGEL